VSNEIRLCDLARVGYEAYAMFTGGKTFDGRDMPKWDELPDRIKGAWGAAAARIADHSACFDAIDLGEIGGTE
jgi:hypothetical protein